MSKYWRDLMSSWSSTYTLAGGLFRNEYQMTVMNGASFVDAFAIDLNNLRLRRNANYPFTCFDNAQTIGEECFAGTRGSAYVVKLSSTFYPSSTTKADANGTAVMPVLETGYYTPWKGKARWRRWFVPVDMRDAASDNPTLTVGYVAHPADTYTTLTAAIPETTNVQDPVRGWFGNSPGQGKLASGMAIKLAQTAASSVTRIYGLRAEVRGREGSRTQ